MSKVDNFSRHKDSSKTAPKSSGVSQNSTSTASHGAAEKKGWLFKYREKVCFPGWRHCWIVLHRYPAAKLCVYAARSESLLDNEAEFVVPLKDMDISHKPQFSTWAKILNVPKNRQHSFQLIPKDSCGFSFHEPFILAASNLQEKERWIHAIMEASSPLPLKANLEPVKCFLPKESALQIQKDNYEVLNELTFSHSCNMLQEQLDLMLACSAKKIFSKAEAEVFKKIRIDHANLVELDKILFMEHRCDPVPEVTAESIVLLYKNFFKHTNSAKVAFFKQLQLAELMNRFDSFCKSSARVLIEKIRQGENFSRQTLKLANGLSVKLICDYRDPCSAAVAEKQRIFFEESIRVQRDACQLMINADFSIDLLNLVLFKGFMMVFTLTFPEVESGVVCDDNGSKALILEKIGIPFDKETDIVSYNLHDRLLHHISFSKFKSFSSSKPHSKAFQTMQIVEDLSISNCFDLISALNFKELVECFQQTQKTHSKYLFAIEIISYALKFVIEGHLRKAIFERDDGFSTNNIVCFILNSLEDADFYASILGTKVAELCDIFGIGGIELDFDSYDRRHICINTLRILGVECSSAFVGALSFPLTSVLFDFKPVFVCATEQKDQLSLKDQLYLRLHAKPYNARLEKDDVIAELLISIAESDAFSVEQRLTLCGLALFFVSCENKFLLSKCLVAILKNSFFQDENLSAVSLIVERIKRELNIYTGFYSLICLDIYDELALSIHSYGKYDYSLGLNEECLGFSCKMLGRTHLRSIQFQHKVGNDYMMMNNFDAALCSFYECQRFYLQADNSEQISRLNDSIARCMFLKGDISSALSYNEKSIVYGYKRTDKDSLIDLIDAFVFKSKMCEYQFSNVEKLTSIITPQIEYYMNESQQALEKLLEIYKENRLLYEKEIDPIVEKLVRLSFLLMNQQEKQLTMMLTRKFANADPYDFVEKKTLIKEAEDRLPARFIRTLLQKAGNEADVTAEKKLFMLYKMSNM